MTALAAILDRHLILRRVLADRKQSNFVPSCAAMAQQGAVTSA